MKLKHGLSVNVIEVLNITESPIKGPKGNIQNFYLLPSIKNSEDNDLR